MDEKTKYRLNVHNSHCCARCGCKYGDDDCPVMMGTVKGLSQCEKCGALFNDAIRAFFRLTAEEKEMFIRKITRKDNEPDLCPRCQTPYAEKDYNSGIAIGVDECSTCEDEWVDTHNSFFAFGEGGNY